MALLSQGHRENQGVIHISCKTLNVNIIPLARLCRPFLSRYGRLSAFKFNTGVQWAGFQEMHQHPTNTETTNASAAYQNGILGSCNIFSLVG
jgi:hypothetical protein